jgi:hypothetical protein
LESVVRQCVAYPLRLEFVEVPLTVRSGSECQIRLALVPQEAARNFQSDGNSPYLVCASWFCDDTTMERECESIRWKLPLDGPIPLENTFVFLSPGPAEIQLLVTDAPTGFLIWDLVLKPLVIP